MLIENELGATGTGFLITRNIDDERFKVFLATNKHVLHKDLEGRLNANVIYIHCNVSNPDGSTSRQRIGLTLETKDGEKLYREHPEHDVDVLAIDVSQIIKLGNIVHKRIGYSLICNSDILEQEDITQGEDIMTIGYPEDFRHRTNNYPLFRSGIIATRIGEELEDTIRERARARAKANQHAQ